MRTTHRIAIVLLSLVLSGCAMQQPVEVLRPDEFSTMATRLRTELVRRGLLDENGAYEPGLPMNSHGEYRPASFGEELYKRLSTRFRMPDAATGGLTPETFAASASPRDDVRIGKGGFVMAQGMDIITVSIIAVTDWNGDGVNDWLLVCRVKPLLGNGPRDYYLAVDNVTAEGVLQPKIIAIYDCQDGTCVLVTGKARKDVLGFDPEHPYVDATPGDQVTLPPGSPAPTGGVHEDRRVEEQSLAN